MLKRKRTIMVGVVVVLAILMGGSSGDCDFNSSDDCLFLCSSGD